MPGLSGHHARILVNDNNNYRATRWSVDWKVEDFDTTTFENFDVGIYTPGLNDFTVSFDAFWDTADNPFNAPLSIVPGETIRLRIQFDKSLDLTPAAWEFQRVLVVDCRSEGAVRDVVRLSFLGKVTAYQESWGLRDMLKPQN